MAVDKADRFWPDVTRLVVAILIVLLILAGDLDLPRVADLYGELQGDDDQARRQSSAPGFSPSPRRARPTHFDAVWREQPTTGAAAVIVAPAQTNPTSLSRWRRLKRTLCEDCRVLREVVAE